MIVYIEKISNFVIISKTDGILSVGDWNWRTI